MATECGFGALRAPTFEPIEALVTGLRVADEARDVYAVTIAHHDEFVDVRSLRCDPIGKFADLAIM